MSTEETIFSTFAVLFNSRVGPIFPQTAGAIVTPAARYTILGGTIDTDVCGVGLELTDDISFQLDVVAATQTARMNLRPQVRAAAAAAVPPMILRGPPVQEYDADTKTYRETFEFTIYGSDTA